MIYLDNASTTMTDPRVLEAMMPYLTDSYGNAGTLYGHGRKSADAIAEARERAAAFIGAKPGQVIFTSGGSEANSLVFAGSRSYLTSAGKTRIVTTQIEHDSVLNAVNNLCRAQDAAGGPRTKPQFDAAYVPPEKSSSVSCDTVIGCMEESPDTGLVSVMHTNNETGLENRGLGRIGEACRSRGALFHTDCVQAAGCGKISVDDIRCDFLSVSSHKIHGPKGVGALYVRDRATLSPMIFGGRSQEFGLRGGTENVAGIVGFGKACEILLREQEADAEYVSGLRRLLYRDVQKHLAGRGLGDACRINGDMDLNGRGKTISVRFDSVDGETLLLLPDARGVCVSAGSACRSRESQPSHVLLAMGVSPEDARNSVRFSLSRMNTVEEAEAAAEIIADCVWTLRRGIDSASRK